GEVWVLLSPMSGCRNKIIMPPPCSGGLSLRDGQGGQCPAEHHQALHVDHCCAPQGLEPGLLLAEIPTPRAAPSVPMGLLALNGRPLPHQLGEVRSGALLPSRLQLVLVRVDVDSPPLPRLLDALAHERTGGAGGGGDHPFGAVAGPKAWEPGHRSCGTEHRARL